MPFNFKQYKHYSINYSDLFDEFNSKEILSDRKIQSHYLESWIKTLKTYDDIITDQLKSKEDIKKMISYLQPPLQPPHEIFQFPSQYGSNEILIHFSASVANGIIPSGTKGTFIPLDEFVKEDRSVYWTPVDEDVSSYSGANQPIIVVPYLNGQYGDLVIDGNHRVTYKVKNNINNIHAILISEQSVIEQAFFMNWFDMMFYIMHNELSHVANETHLNKTEASELVRKSYLVDNKFKFI
ncbi:ParB/Srx family N-terminal domain-containing protein [Clostridium beijerinckii]|uniref:ParB/Srx family N-terminal domain-containing protein n=1 Tax=Clostridium beijerinckii TaxID=1520 RepID=UPI0003D31FF0|nr:ParB/Srx family N-terminal domain-containing protein [Clostridium beijerinckii]ALB46232.1 hypothetical protein X276_13800 [Clostridium beijerinckii NRRL B-598]